MEHELRLQLSSEFASRGFLESLPPAVLAKSPLWRIGDAQLQAAPRVAMEISSWGEAVASCEAQRSVGCCFVGAIRLEKEPVRGTLSCS